MKRFAGKTVLLTGATALLAACSHDFDASLPYDIPPTFEANRNTQAPKASAWWVRFGSGELDGYMAAASDDNLDIAVAAAQLVQAEALALADSAIVAPIYAAREAPDPSVSNQILAHAAAGFGGDVIALDSFDEIRDALLREGDDAIIITMGAGDIYKVAEQIAD